MASPMKPIRKFIPYSKLERQTEEHLDETHDPVKFRGAEYSFGFALKRIDVIYFDQVVAEYIESLLRAKIIQEVEGEYYEVYRD